MQDGSFLPIDRLHKTSYTPGCFDTGISVDLLGTDAESPAVRYLNSAGFFEVLSDGEKKRLAPRETTIEFTAIRGTEHVNFLHMRLRPWIAREVRLSNDTVESLSACIAEALQNIEHHGGELGFAMAQHYPKKKELRIAVADRGVGIPVHVRKIVPELKDPAALRNEPPRVSWRPVGLSQASTMEG